MPRRPRLDLAGVAQRGNDRQPCFFTHDDYLRYLGNLNEVAINLGCHVHAYVLMTNHVHLLLTPSVAGAVSRLMQTLGRRYVSYVNTRYHRTGALWEGRFKSTFVDNEDYLLRCYRYIELNPVRARMVVEPGGYPWSSYLCNAQGEVNPLIQPHPAYLALAADRRTRCVACRDMVMEAVDSAETDAIRLHLQRGYPYGSQRFRQAIERQLGRCLVPAKVGRPKKRESAL